MASDLHGAAVDATTTDFSSFVAASRGISCDEAEELIENWLKDYRPRTRVDVAGPFTGTESGASAERERTPEAILPEAS